MAEWLYFNGDMDGIAIPSEEGEYQVVQEEVGITTCEWVQRMPGLGMWNSNIPVIAWLRPDGVESVVN